MFTQLLQLAGLARKWPIIHREEVAKHNTRDSLWITVDDAVLDITPLIGKHPGGDSALLKRGGGVHDCTEDLMFHGRSTRNAAWQYQIGALPREEVHIQAQKADTNQSSVPLLEHSAGKTHKTVRIPSELHGTHASECDSEEWGNGITEFLLSSSDTEILVASDTNAPQPIPTL